MTALHVVRQRHHRAVAAVAGAQALFPHIAFSPLRRMGTVRKNRI
jgi:hypothetical protein